MKNASLIVFVQFYYALDAYYKKSGLPNNANVNISVIFKQELLNIGMTSTKRTEIERFFLKPVGSLNINFSEKESTFITSIQNTYEYLCEEIGPVETDRLFGLAVDKVSKTKAAQEYSPYQFL